MPLIDKNNSKKIEIDSIRDMIANDINECQEYIDNPLDETNGRRLYSIVTARYDNIIDNFGSGLYSYIAEHRFYDPEVDIGTINHNLNILLQKMIAYRSLKFGNSNQQKGIGTIMSNEKVFIVHGHDNEAKQETARFIESVGLQAIILHEQASGGKTIMEKIEELSDVGFAVVLYTPCDKGKSNKEPKYKNRARQNVVFEHGYLIGKLGRDRVCALVKGQIETPGDVSGIVYVDMDSSGAWKSTVANEMNSVGFKIDKNNI